MSCFSRYSIERVFRPRKLDRAHPRELLECAFDIITPVTNSLLPDAETIYTISEIIQEFPGLQVLNTELSVVTSCLIVSHFPTDAFTAARPVVVFSRAASRPRSWHTEAHVRLTDLPHIRCLQSKSVTCRSHGSPVQSISCTRIPAAALLVRAVNPVTSGV